MAIRSMDSPQGPGYENCQCSCHKTNCKVYHVMACCYPGKRSLFESVKENNVQREILRRAMTEEEESK